MTELAAEKILFARAEAKRYVGRQIIVFGRKRLRLGDQVPLNVEPQLAATALCNKVFPTGSEVFVISDALASLERVDAAADAGRCIQHGARTTADACEQSALKHGQACDSCPIIDLGPDWVGRGSRFPAGRREEFF